MIRRQTKKGDKMKKLLIIALLIVGCEGILVEPEDCAGVVGGDAVEDNCGICDVDNTNDFIQDCAGDWGGESVDDCDGVCNGDAVVLWETCYATDITVLELDSRGLTGEIPPDIGNLMNLQQLWLSNNIISLRIIGGWLLN